MFITTDYNETTWVRMKGSPEHGFILPLFGLGTGGGFSASLGLELSDALTRKSPATKFGLWMNAVRRGNGKTACRDGYNEFMGEKPLQTIPAVGRAALGAISGILLMPVIAVVLGYGRIGEPMTPDEASRFFVVTASIGPAWVRPSGLR